MQTVFRETLSLVHRFEVAMGGGLSSTSVRVVHDVVVHEGCRVEDLERGGQGKRRVLGGGRNTLAVEAGDGPVAPVAEARSESLSSTKQRL